MKSQNNGFFYRNDEILEDENYRLVVRSSESDALIVVKLILDE